MNKILIVEDDATIVEGLESAFAFHGYRVTSVDSSEKGLREFQRERPDLVVLDVMLPGLDGFAACKRIRELDDRVPVIMLTAKSGENDKLLGFELGADDYITKPFSAKELMARVRAVLKRSALNPGSAPEPVRKTVSIGGAEVNYANFTITKNCKESPLSPKEHAILKLFTDNPDTVVSRSRIIDEVWGDEYYPSPKTIDNFVVKLRVKIEDNPKKPAHILTVHGAGYKFKY
ncbi:MAG: response regulator transcription factor [bacterium]|nr:response regulator transcription factor [bacterium]